MGKRVLGAIAFIAVAAILGFYLGFNWLESRDAARNEAPTATAVTVDNDILDDANEIELDAAIASPTAIGQLNLTVTALAAENQPTPVPTNTATPLPPPTEPACLYAYTLLLDVTIPPGTQMTPNTLFQKTWRIRNDGTCAWESGSAWMFVGGDQMSAPDLVTLPLASPGQTVDITVDMLAPPTTGTYTGFWQPRLPDGSLMQPASSVSIVVTNPNVPTGTAVAPLPTAAPGATATPIITNWRGEYYNNKDLQGSPAFVRDDPAIDFNWGATAPGPGLSNGNYSVRWTRTINAAPGTYRFYAVSDDGVRVWVNGVLLFDEWHTGTNATYQSDVTLRGGEQLDVRVEYYQGLGTASVRVWAELQADYPNWRGSYYRNVDFSGDPRVVRNDVAIDFNWGTGAPAAGMPADNFSVAWIQTIRMDAGTYNFYAEVDDGMRLLIDGQVVLNAWEGGTLREVSASYRLSSGPHDFTILYFERLDNAQIKVWWERATFE